MKSVEAQSCKVTFEDGTGGVDVKGILLGFDKSGLIVYPKVNTDVMVVFTDNSKTYGAVLIVKETDKVEIMGNNKGGLAIVAELTKKYNNLEKDLNNLKQIFSSTWSPVAYDGGAALKAAAASWAGQTLTETQDSDIENTKVKQGDGQ